MSGLSVAEYMRREGLLPAEPEPAGLTVAELMQQEGVGEESVEPNPVTGDYPDDLPPEPEAGGKPPPRADMEQHVARITSDVRYPYAPGEGPVLRTFPQPTYGKYGRSHDGKVENGRPVPGWIVDVAEGVMSDEAWNKRIKRRKMYADAEKLVELYIGLADHHRICPGLGDRMSRMGELLPDSQVFVRDDPPVRWDGDVVWGRSLSREPLPLSGGDTCPWELISLMGEPDRRMLWRLRGAERRLFVFGTDQPVLTGKLRDEVYGPLPLEPDPEVLTRDAGLRPRTLWSLAKGELLDVPFAQVAAMTDAELSQVEGLGQMSRKDIRRVAEAHGLPGPGEAAAAAA